MYGLENKILNESSNAAWYNFGYWTTGDEYYEQACENLATKLAEAARLSETECIFDIGGGCGDQQLLWLRKYNLKHIYAINISSVQVNFARERIQRAGLDESITVERAGLASHSSQKPFDCVVSLDAAYHIDKTLLFSECARLTDRGARLALTDLTLDSGARKWFSRCMLRLICAGSDIPFAQLRTAENLRVSGEPFGWHNTLYEDVTEAVFGGYARFMRQSRAQLWRRHGLRSLRFIFTGIAIASLLRRKLLRYVIVVFEKRETDYS